MQELTKGHVCLFRGQEETARYSYDGSQFRAERAIVICELYRKGDDWRFNAVGRGFNGGLKALVEHFGGTVAESTPAAPSIPNRPPVSPLPRASVPSPNRPTTGPSLCRISSPHFHPCLRPHGQPGRQCRGDTEYLTSLYKNMFACLASHPEVAEMPVQVVTCADASGSMFDLYRNGRMQRVVDKFLPLQPPYPIPVRWIYGRLGPRAANLAL